MINMLAPQGLTQYLLIAVTNPKLLPLLVLQVVSTTLAVWPLLPLLLLFFDLEEVLPMFLAASFRHPALLQSLTHICAASLSSLYWHDKRIQYLLLMCVSSLVLLRPMGRLRFLSLCYFLAVGFYDQSYKQVFQEGWILMLGLVGLVILLTLSIISFGHILSKSKSNLRKLFHILPLLLYLGGINLSYELTKVVFATAYAAFSLLQEIRGELKLLQGPLFVKIYKYFQQLSPFLDERDKDQWHTHLSLCMGVLYPLILHPYPHSSIGLIFIVADAFAALLGKAFGRHKLPINRTKSWQGFLGFVVSGLVLGLCTDMNRTAMSIAVLLGGVVQGLTQEVDNLLVPLIMTGVYQMFN